MKKGISFISILLLIIIICPAFASAAQYSPNFEPTSEAVFFMNMESGETVYEKNADKALPPAALNQIMTAIVVMENVEDLDAEQATAKPYLFDELYKKNVSTADIRQRETLTIRQLLNCMLVQSAYEAASVLADYVGDGSFAYFVEKMNQKAADLGCENTHFTNPHGLYDEKQYTCARDMAKIAQYAMTLPGFAEMVKQPNYTVDANNIHATSRVLVNTNKLIVPSSEYYYKYAQGIKTSASQESGRCLVSTATNKGISYMCVIMNAPMYDSNQQLLAENVAFTETKNMYEWAFKSFQIKTLLDIEEPCAEVKVKLASDKDYLLLYPKEKFISLVPEEIDSTSVQLRPVLPESVKAPVKSGDIIGKVQLVLSGEVIGEIDLVSRDNVEASKLMYYIDLLETAVNSLWFKLALVGIALLVAVYVTVTIIHNKNKKKHKNYRPPRKFKY